MYVNTKYGILRVWQRYMFVICLRYQHFSGDCDKWLKK